MEEQKSGLIKVTETAYYVPGRVNAGVVKGGGACFVIDTGLDKSAANRISAALDAGGLEPRALLLTHTHADHCGGNAALCGKYGIPAYGPSLEAAILSYPILEPVYLYGAAPPEELRSKFFLAPLTPDARPLQPGRHEIGGVCVTAVSLPGHSPDHYGYLAGDGALFLGDAVLPGYVWEKYRLPYFYDIGAALSSLDTLEGMAGSVAACVSAHHGIVDLAEQVRANRDGLNGMAEWAMSVLKKAPATREGLMAAAFNGFGMEQSKAQYWLVGSTVAALLTYLCEQGMAEAKMNEGRLLYSRI
jgi:glyoxylase-like metal-dependent hydrolase (beta-lactamase superfamily II)